jgi:hypothetical protein
MHAEYRERWKDSVAEQNALVALDRLQTFNDRLRAFKGKNGDYTIVRLRAAAELFRRDLLSIAVARVKAYCSDPSELARAYALAALIAARDSTPRAIDDSDVERILRPHDFDPATESRADDPDLAALVEEAKAHRALNDNSHEAVAQYVVAKVVELPTHSRKLKLRS